MPSGAIHTFADTDRAPARFLNIHQPLGFEQYVKEMGRRSGAGSFPTREEMRSLARPYDVEPVSEPTLQRRRAGGTDGLGLVKQAEALPQNAAR